MGRNCLSQNFFGHVLKMSKRPQSESIESEIQNEGKEMAISGNISHVMSEPLHVSLLITTGYLRSRILCDYEAPMDIIMLISQFCFQVDLHLIPIKHLII